MAINPSLQQPPPDERDCGQCGRLCTGEKDSTLYHCSADGSPIFDGVQPEAFSLWIYRCWRCRIGDTKRSPDLRLTEQQWAFINTMREDVTPPFFRSCTPKTSEQKSIAKKLVKRGLARWVSQWPLEDDALYLTHRGYERMGWDARFVPLEE